nr:TIM barrel protein [Burkholderia multivorans]
MLAIEKVLHKLAPAARANGTHLNIETHDEITSFEILRLIERVGADCTGVVFDTANVLQRGEHPVFAARRLAPHVRQTHIKDAYVARAPGGLDFQTRRCGEGIADFETVIPIVADANPGLHGLRRNAGADVVRGGRVHRERHANPREGHPIYLSHGHMSGQPGLVENRSRDRITTQE